MTTSTTYHDGGKQEVIESFRVNENDTGSVEVQVALLTTRVEYITGHLKKFKKDKHSRHGLLKLVNQRKRLLKYLRRTEPTRYSSLVSRLSLRDSA